MKKARLKMSHSVRLYLFDILEKAKQRRQKIDQWFVGVGI